MAFRTLLRSLTTGSRLIGTGRARRQETRTRRSARHLAVEQLDRRTLLSVGGLDPTFGDGGKVLTVGASAADFALQPDGKVVMMGYDEAGYRLTRYNVDGSPDLAFGTVGATDLDGGVRLAIQADGKIVVTGDDYGSGAALSRYNADGTPDTGFGTGGHVVHRTRDPRIAIQADGRIVLAGTRDLAYPDPSGQSRATSTFALERYNADGSLDDGSASDSTPADRFGSEGMVVTEPGQLPFVTPEGIEVEVAYLGSWAQVASIAIRDGKIVVAGTYNAIVSVDRDFVFSPQSYLATARYNVVDGSPDASFDNDGVVVTDSRSALGLPTNTFVWRDAAYGAVVQADGKIVVASHFGHGSDALVRYNVDGSLDTGYGSAGVAAYGFDDSTGAVAIQADGKVVTAGPIYSEATGTAFSLVRFNADGSPDTSFGTGGRVTTDVTSGEDISIGVAFMIDGSIVVVGNADYYNTSGSPGIALSRYRSSLNVDPGTIVNQLQDIVGTLRQTGSGNSVTLQAATIPQVDAAIAAVNALAADPARPVTVTLDLGNATIKTDSHIVARDGITVVIRNGTLVGGSPALIVDAGEVILDGVTAINGTAAPTIVVNGGSLTVRNSTIQESTGYARMAILVNGGTVDLGTADDPGGNTININGLGLGLAIVDASPNPVSAVGNTFRFNGTAITDPFRIEDLIVDAMDLPNVGLVTLVPGNVYVSALLGSIQRGVDSVAPGVTVHVEGVHHDDYNAGGNLVTVAFQNGPTLTQQSDPLYPGKTELVVAGTVENDKIAFNPGGGPGAIAALINDLPRGIFKPTGRLMAHGLAGDDDIQVDVANPLPAWLSGDDGNDNLKGGSGNNVILGGAGDDLLVGGSNRDLLIGGAGADRIVGNAGDDILISGTTAYDAVDAALAAVLAEWTSARDYATRVANLKGTGSAPRNNGSLFLTTDGPGVTVLDDGAVDVLTGSGGQDWFLFNVDGDGVAKKKDKVTDLTATEFSSDLDFINAP